MASPSSNSKQNTAHQKSAGQLVLVLGLVAFAALGLYFAMRTVAPIKERRQAESVSPVVTSTAMAPTSQAQEPEPTVETPESAPRVIPAASIPDGSTCNDQKTICIAGLQKNAEIDNPSLFTVMYMGNDEDMRLDVNIEDAEGNGFAYATGPVEAASAASRPDTLEVRAFWQRLPSGTAGSLRVSSVKDRRISLEMPVRFVKKTSMTRSLYFLSDKAAETDCSNVSATPVTLPASIYPVEATLRALLAIDSSDTPNGATTSIPDRTGLVSLTVANGTATAVFDAGLERDGGGSCRVGAIRAQIEQTLKQFSSVKNVVIEVDGKTAEETLQP